jgi:arginine-tRNA-protein transferase
VRIPVERFQPTRGQKRVWHKNQDITVHTAQPVFRGEHFDLYRRYQSARHAGSSMDDPDPERYIGFLASRQADTIFYEMRLARPEGPADSPGTLLGVAIVDILPTGLSAVYTFFGRLWRALANHRGAAPGAALPLPGLLDRRNTENGL